MSNKREIPFTEICERAQRIAREDAINVIPKYKGLVNDTAIKILPRIYDWRPLMRTSYIQCSACVTTGQVNVLANSPMSNIVTGIGTAWTFNMTSELGWKIKFSGNDNVYDFDYTTPTTAVITPALSGATSITSGGYNLFRDTYALHSTLDRFLINGGLEWTRSGLPEVIMECPEDQWKDEYQCVPATQLQRMRTLGIRDISGNKQVQVNPPPQQAILCPYDFIKMLLPMTDYSTGTVSKLVNGTVAVTGIGTSWAGYLQTGYTYYLRINRDGTGDSSVWYQILSATGGGTITLSENYNGVTVDPASLIIAEKIPQEYVISMVPEWPADFHDAILYKAAALGISDQDDPMFKYYELLAKTAFDELKTIYKTRTYNKAVAVDMDRR